MAQLDCARPRDRDEVAAIASAWRVARSSPPSRRAPPGSRIATSDPQPERRSLRSRRYDHPGLPCLPSRLQSSATLAPLPHAVSSDPLPLLAVLPGPYGNVCSLVPPPFPVMRARLDRALARRDLAGVRSAAGELPSVVSLADAVDVLVLMLEADDPAFEAAAVRWLAQFTGECAGVTLGEAQAALEGLDALPAADARTTLTALLKRHGLA
jgi:hypothetical protein